jgi:CPA2 family monovalent cation:H+ antiporter-2
VAVLGKSAIATLAVLALGMPGRAALLSGLALAQVGEFSFVLARVGIQAGAIPQSVFDQILATAVVTIVLTPFALRAAPRLATALAGVPAVGRRFAEPPIESAIEPGSRGHAVICGFGRVARELAAALDARRLRYLVIEYNPQIVRELRGRGVTVTPTRPCSSTHTSRARGCWPCSCPTPSPASWSPGTPARRTRASTSSRGAPTRPRWTG